MFRISLLFINGFFYHITKSFVFVSFLRAFCALTDTDSSADNNEDRGFFPMDFLIRFSVVNFRTEIKYEYDMRGILLFIVELLVAVISSYKSARLMHFTGHSFYNGFLILFMTKLSFEVKHHN